MVLILPIAQMTVNHSVALPMTKLVKLSSSSQLQIKMPVIAMVQQCLDTSVQINNLRIHRQLLILTTSQLMLTIETISSLLV